MKKILSAITVTAIMATYAFSEVSEPKLIKTKQNELLSELKKLKILDSKAFTLNEVVDLGTVYMVNADMSFRGQKREVDIFVNKDKEFIMFGNAYSATTGERYSSVAEPVKKTPAKKDTSGLSELSVFTIGSGKEEYFLFTDPDCPFCKQVEAKLHASIRDDVKVHILPYPLERLRPQAKIKVLSFMEMSPQEKSEIMGKGMASVNATKDFKPKRETVEMLERIKKEANALGLTGTPYLIDANGMRISAEILLKK